MDSNLKEPHPPHSNQPDLFNDRVPHRVRNERAGDPGLRFQLHNEDDTGGETDQNSGERPRIQSLVNSVKKEIRKLIDYNLSGQLQHFSYPSSTKSQNGPQMQQKSIDHPENQHAEKTNDKRSAQLDKRDNQDNGNPDQIPHEILRRSYTNPNFYSSTHSQFQSSGNSLIQDTPASSLDMQQHPGATGPPLIENDSKFSGRKERSLSAHNELTRQEQRISYLRKPASRQSTE